MTATNYMITLEGRSESDTDDLHFLLMSPENVGITNTPVVPNSAITALKEMCDASDDDAFWAFPDLKTVANEAGEEIPHDHFLLLNTISTEEAWFAVLLEKADDQWIVKGIHADEIFASEDFQSADSAAKAQMILDKIQDLPANKSKFSTIHLVYPFEAGRNYPF